MVTQFIEWTTRLNETNSFGFAIVTVGTMIAVGVGIALAVELIFKIFGIKAEKVEHHH